MMAGLPPRSSAAGNLITSFASAAVLPSTLLPTVIRWPHPTTHRELIWLNLKSRFSATLGRVRGTSIRQPSPLLPRLASGRPGITFCAAPASSGGTSACSVAFKSPSALTFSYARSRLTSPTRRASITRTLMSTTATLELSLGLPVITFRGSSGSASD